MKKPILSGSVPTWLASVANEVMDADASHPMSVARLYNVVPGRVGQTAVNDGHTTAAENGQPREDYRAGQRILVDEAVRVLRAANLIEGSDDQLLWVAEPDGKWRVKYGRANVALYGRAERTRDRDETMLGTRPELPEPKGGVKPGLLLTGESQPLEVNVITKSGEIGKPRLLDVHRLAMMIPPMSAKEQADVRRDIELHGVRVPIVLYGDERDLTKAGKPVLKILDGRHRAYFASVTGRPVRTETFEGTEEDAKAYVISLNIHRRNLSTAQRALVVLQMFGEEAKAEAKAAEHAGRPSGRTSGQLTPPSGTSGQLTPPSGGNGDAGRWADRAIEMAGGQTVAGVSATSLKRIDAAVKADPTIGEKIESGEITSAQGALSEAKRTQQAAPVPPSEPVAEPSKPAEPKPPEPEPTSEPEPAPAHVHIPLRALVCKDCGEILEWLS